MRCGCKSRGNANLYLCVRHQKDNFHALTFLLLAFPYCWLLFVVSSMSISSLSLRRKPIVSIAWAMSIHIQWAEHNWTQPNKTQEHEPCILYFFFFVFSLFGAFLCKISEAFLQAEKQFFRVAEAENRLEEEHEKKKIHTQLVTRTTRRQWNITAKERNRMKEIEKEKEREQMHWHCYGTKRTVSANNLNMKIYRQIVLFVEHFDKSKLKTCRNQGSPIIAQRTGKKALR